MKKAWLMSIILVSMALNGSAQIAPTFEIGDPISIFSSTVTKEAGIAVNEKEQEVLFVTIASDTGGTDPITGEEVQQAVYGFYYDPVTLKQLGEPFMIMGNPMGTLQKLSVTYNSVSNRYFVAVAADTYSPAGCAFP